MPPRSAPGSMVVADQNRNQCGIQQPPGVMPPEYSEQTLTGYLSELRRQVHHGEHHGKCYRCCPQKRGAKSCAALAYVPIAEGSSSAAPVMRPRPTARITLCLSIALADCLKQKPLVLCNVLWTLPASEQSHSQTRESHCGRAKALPHRHGDGVSQLRRNSEALHFNDDGATAHTGHCPPPATSRDHSQRLGVLAVRHHQGRIFLRHHTKREMGGCSSLATRALILRNKWNLT